MRTPARILVVKLATLGDTLTITPALRALRTTFREAHIGVLTTDLGAATLGRLDSLDEVIVFDKFVFDRPVDAARSLPLAARLAADLRAGDWDTLVLLHHLTTRFGIAKYAALSLGSGAPRRVGLDNGRGWFLTHRALDRGFGWRHEVDYWLDVVGVLGAVHPRPPRLELPLTDEHYAWADHTLSGLSADGRAVLLVPGSGAFSHARRWSPARFSEVGAALSRTHHLRPLVLSGLEAEEKDLARRVAVHIGPHARVVPAAPSPQTLGALLQRCTLVVANDSGPVHIATAVGTPVVAIFGPSNDRAWGPYPPEDPAHQIVREQVACAPCIHRGHDFGTPQGCPARTCLAIVEVADVLAAAERALATTSSLARSR